MSRPRETGSNSERLIERRKAAVARGVGMFAGQTTAVSGRGARLIDSDGREYIDFAGGIGVMNVGHCDEEVVRAIRDQAGQLLHSCIHVATYEPYVALCEKLGELLPHGNETKAMLVNSGAEAVENAVKIARQATGRAGILCFEGAFHGRTLMGMTLTSKSSYKRRCGPFAPEVYRAPYPNFGRDGRGLTSRDFSEREIAALRARFITGPVPADHFAAVVIEVVQGEGGFIPAPPEYLQGLRKLCDEHGILLICDEVQTGFGRTGRWAAHAHSGITPDLSTWAKSLGGGLPIGAVVGKAAIMDAAEPGTIGGTFGGNPVACAAALSTLRVIERKGLCQRAEKVGSRIRERLEALKSRCELVYDVRGMGAMMAIEFCHDRDPSRPATEQVAEMAALCRADGVLVLTAGPFSNILRILCPLVIEDSDLDRGLSVIEGAAVRVSRNGGRL